MNERTWDLLLRIAALAFALGVSVLIILHRERVSEFALLGYPGIFLVSLMGTATVLFPVPHLALIFAIGSAFNPWLVGLVGGLGDTTGEITGYLTGFAFEGVAERWRLYHHFERWMERSGDLTLFLLALIPNPLFDMASIAGGLTGYPLWRFLLVTWVGKTLKLIAFAWAGYYGVQWIQNFLQ